MEKASPGDSLVPNYLKTADDENEEDGKDDALNRD
jgi:hypothetical protein